MDIAQLLVYLTPFIVLFVAWVAEKVLPLIPGWAMLLVTTAVATAFAFVSQLLLDPMLEWWQQLIYGLVAVFLHQLGKQLSPEKRQADKKEIATAKRK